MSTAVHALPGHSLDLGDLAQAAAAFVQNRHLRLTTWEFSITRLPANWNYLVFAGLGTLIEQLQTFRISAEQIEYLHYHPAFAGIPLSWFEHLRTLRFEGELWAMPEGSVCSASEPVVRITAPFDMAALISPLIMGTLTHQMQVAGKVSRLLTAAEGRMLMERSASHASDPFVALTTTRAAYLAGILTTTNAEAARLLQLPSHVLMPAAWPMLYQDEVEAFHRYGSSFSTMCLPIVDLQDALSGIKHAIASGSPLHAVCLEQCDQVSISLEARRLLDQSGRKHVKIFATGELDEEKIARLLSQRAAIDGFAVGAILLKSVETSALRGVYKLVARQECDGSWEPARRWVAGKQCYPWSKQVYRQALEDGSFAGDIIARETETIPCEPLLVPVMKQGSLSTRLPSLEEARDYSMMQRVRLPLELLELTAARQMYPIRYSEALEGEAARQVMPRRS